MGDTHVRKVGREGWGARQCDREGEKAVGCKDTEKQRYREQQRMTERERGGWGAGERWRTKK